MTEIAPPKARKNANFIHCTEVGKKGRNGIQKLLKRSKQGEWLIVFLLFSHLKVLTLAQMLCRQLHCSLKFTIPTLDGDHMFQ
jgi:hypothetical protein